MILVVYLNHVLFFFLHPAQVLAFSPNPRGLELPKTGTSEKKGCTSIVAAVRYRVTRAVAQTRS